MAFAQHLETFLLAITSSSSKYWTRKEKSSSKYWREKKNVHPNIRQEKKKAFFRTARDGTATSTRDTRESPISSSSQLNGIVGSWRRKKIVQLQFELKLRCIEMLNVGGSPVVRYYTQFKWFHHILRRSHFLNHILTRCPFLQLSPFEIVWHEQKWFWEIVTFWHFENLPVVVLCQ